MAVAFVLAGNTSIALAQEVQSLEKDQINNMRLWHSPESTRVVFDVSADVKHKVFTLSAPPRLVVDIENAEQSFVLPAVDANSKRVRAIRSGVPKTGVLRFVLELNKPLQHSSFVLSPNELYGHRLVVDLTDPDVDLISTLADSSTSPRESGKEVGVELKVDKPKSIKPSPPDPRLVNPERREFIIAIDAGHGGEDPGALGYKGSREKKLTLSIAKKLKAIVDKDPNMSGMLVRSGDYYVKLHRRREIARQAQADLFISIHADAFRKRSASGFSVFALSQRGATSAMAGALAAKENASDLIGGVSLADKDEVLAKVLVDLSMTNTISESVNLGGRVLKELSKLGKLHSKRVEQAGFAVLKSADIPSILVETGFITNPKEERNLRSSRYQQKVARAIYEAVKNYRQQTPYYASANYAAPNVDNASTFVSKVMPSQRRNSGDNKERKVVHKVVRGDTLSGIANRYRVSLSALKKANKLRKNTAVLGSRLKIPCNNCSAAAGGQTHVVKTGDSLSKISLKYNVTINAIKRLNKLSKNTLYVGQKLIIPSGASLSKPSRSAKPVTYKVKRGDTLSHIAQRYNVSMSHLMSLNKLSKKTIYVGQKLTISKP